MGRVTMGCTVKPSMRASGLQLAHPLQHLLGGADRLLRRAQAEAHAADIGFMRDVLGEDLDRQSRRLLQQAGGDGFHLLRRSRHAGGDRRDAVGGKHRLGLGLCQHRAPGGGGIAHDGARRLLGDMRRLRFPWRGSQHRFLRLCVLPQIEKAFDRVGRRFVGRNRGLAEQPPSARGRIFAEPIGQDSRRRRSRWSIHCPGRRSFCRSTPEGPPVRLRRWQRAGRLRAIWEVWRAELRRP